MKAILKVLCGGDGKGAMEDVAPVALERERRESFATKALHMVAGDGSFLAQNRGSERLPEDFNCDDSTAAFEVVLTGADPDVSRAATLEVRPRAG